MYYINHELVNVVELDPFEIESGNFPDEMITIDELIDRIKNKKPIKQGIKIHFNMYDIIYDVNSHIFMHDTFIHIPTNTKIFVEYDENWGWERTFLLIPNYSEKIWIGDNNEDCWWDATHNEGSYSFEMKSFIEIEID